MSNKSKKVKKTKKFMCIYNPPPPPEKPAGYYSISYSVLKELYYGEKANLKNDFGDIVKSMVNPDPENWIELNLDFEQEQVFY